MESKASSDTTSLKSLRMARSLSQNEVAEAIGTNANTVSRWERGIATPSPYYRRKLAELFGIDPQELLPSLNGETDKITEELPPEPEPVGDAPNETEEASQEASKIAPTRPEGLSRLPFIHTMPRPHWGYALVASFTILMLVLGGVFVFPSLLPKPSTDLFPALCNGNFQSINSVIVDTPPTSTSPDGEPIGLSKGANIFDLHRPNEQEVQYKRLAAQATMKDPQIVASWLKNALSIDPTDAEAQIYLENWKALGSNHPHITFVVGVNFRSSSAGGSYGTLRGAFTTQKECNKRNWQDANKTLVVLMIANISGNKPDDRANSAKFVANQIADQARKDSTIVGIMGWPTSADSIDVNRQLKIRGSHLPMISTSSSSDELGGMSNFFRICPKNSEQAQMAANFLLKMKQKKRIAILYDQTTSFSFSLQEDFAKEIPNNRSGLPIPYTGNDLTTLQDALNKTLAQNPDAIFFAGYLSGLVVLLSDISSTDAANLLIVGEDGLASTSDYTSIPPGLDHVYITAFASPNQWNNPKPPFFREYKNNFGTLTAPTGLPSIDADAMLGYDALLSLLHGTQQILSRQSTITPSDLTEELKKITVTNPIQGITGRIAFDSNGNQAPGKMIFVEHIVKINDKTYDLQIDEKHGCLLKDHCSL